jgi:apolipoprotein N-acyltransferase
LKKIKPVYLAILSGLFLFASWPISPLTFFIFFAFVPLLFVATQVNKRSRFFWLTYLTLFIWNIGTTWWVLNSTVIGGVLAIVLNPLLMCIPWMGFYNIKKRFGATVGFISLIVFWLTFEWIHLNWELSWPWLTLGNVFATHPAWVQWYEYTGTSGGTLWVLLINISIFQLLQKAQNAKRETQNAQGKTQSQPIHHSPFTIHNLVWLLADLILPFLVSYLIINSFKPETENSKLKSSNIVLVQPNIDPWDEKFAAGKEEAELRQLIQLSESQIDSNTALVVWPETAVPVPVKEDSMKTNYFIQPAWDFLKKHPKINLLTGVEGFRVYDEQHKTSNSQKIPGTNKYFEEYNSAVLMDSNNFQVYHKSKLVPGAEILPWPLKFMGSWFEEFGGTAGGYVKQDERTVFKTYNNSYKIAPAVCYESIYGEFMSKYVHNGANLIVIITNDGWWRNTSGYKQHENYARLRAIETRCWVARSANTGITCFIDPYGEVINPQPYNTIASIKLNVPESKAGETFYVKYGDIISKLAMIFAILLVLWDVIAIIKSKRSRG